MIAMPLARGAGAITSMVRADGIVRLGPGVELVEAGSEVEVELLRPLAAVQGAIVIAGSHDPALAVLEDVLRARSPRHAITVRSVGSSAGLAALERGEVHAAAVHLEPPAGGDEHDAGSVSAVLARVRATCDVVAVHLVRRDIGLIVAPGNPLGLRAADDLLRPDVRTPPEVERSAVRLLGRTAAADRRDAAARNARDDLEMTPLAVAAAVQSGLADAGLGSAAAAAALGLDFVPLASEDYALVLRGDVARGDAGRALLAAARAAEFRAGLAAIAGCDAARAGEEQGAGGATAAATTTPRA